MSPRGPLATVGLSAASPDWAPVVQFPQDPRRGGCVRPVLVDPFDRLEKLRLAGLLQSEIKHFPL